MNSLRVKPEGSFIYLFIILLVSFLLRLYPYLVSGVPFHTDSWPMLANVDFLMIKTPVALMPESGFDSYNIFWPGLMLFSAVTSTLFGLTPYMLMPIISPLVNSTSILMLFCLMRRLGYSSHVSLISSLFFGVAGGHAVLTAGITKEGFAIPLFFTTLMLLNLSLSMRKTLPLILSILTFGLVVLSHHLTSTVTALLSIYLFSTYLSRLQKESSRLILEHLLTLGAFLLLLCYYLWVYAARANPLVLKESDVISLVAYQAVTCLPLWYGLVFRKRTKLWIRIWTLLGLLAVVALVVLATRVSVVLGSPIISINELILASPYLAIALLSTLSSETSNGGSAGSSPSFLDLWIMGLLGVELYTVFGVPGLSGVTYRLANFLYIGVAMKASLIFTNLLNSRNVVKLCAMILIVALAVGTAYATPYTILSSGPIGGSQRVYSEMDIATVKWVISHLKDDTELLGDLRFSYLLSAYSNRSVDIGRGLLCLTEKNPTLKGCLIVTKLMESIGYIATEYGTKLDSESFNKLFKKFSLIYSNGAVSIAYG